MEKILKALIKKKGEFEASICNMERKIQEVADFDLGIENASGDGLCVINIETSDLATIVDCIRIIERDGALTEINHEAICI